MHTRLDCERLVGVRHGPPTVGIGYSIVIKFLEISVFCSEGTSSGSIIQRQIDDRPTLLVNPRRVFSSYQNIA